MIVLKYNLPTRDKSQYIPELVGFLKFTVNNSLLPTSADILIISCALGNSPIPLSLY